MVTVISVANVTLVAAKSASITVNVAGFVIDVVVLVIEIPVCAVKLLI